MINRQNQALIDLSSLISKLLEEGSVGSGDYRFVRLVRLLSNSEIFGINSDLHLYLTDINDLAPSQEYTYYNARFYGIIRIIRDQQTAYYDFNYDFEESHDDNDDTEYWDSGFSVHDFENASAKKIGVNIKRSISVSERDTPAYYNDALPGWRNHLDKTLTGLDNWGMHLNYTPIEDIYDLVHERNLNKFIDIVFAKSPASLLNAESEAGELFD